jgi:hypothetical protein
MKEEPETVNVSSPPPAEWEQHLTAVLHEQQQLLDELEPLAHRQGRLIQDRATDELLQVLTQRQGLVDRFLDTQRRLALLSGDLPERLGRLPASQQAHLRQLVRRIDEGIATILAGDARDRRDLVEVRDMLRRELSTADIARQAHSAYARHPAATNRFADRQG